MQRQHWLNGERLCVYSWLVLGIFAATFVLWTCLSLPDLVDPKGKPVGYDFICFWSAARLALDGLPAAVFDFNAIEAMHRVAVPALHKAYFLWHYPPTFLLVVLPLGLFPYLAALAVFVAATTLFWAALVRRLLPDPRAWVVAAAAPAGLINLMHGQNGFLTAALAGYALLLLDEQPVFAGVLVGLLAIKPHLAVLFPLALVAQRRWRTIGAAAVTAVVFSLVSIVAFGWDTARAFVNDLAMVRLLMDTGSLPWSMIPSLYAAALSLGAAPDQAMGLQLLLAAFAGFGVWFSWRSPAAPFEAQAAVLATAALLLSPYSFYYDLTWAMLAVAWLALLGLRCGFARGEREILLLAWATPLLMIPFHMASHVQLGFLVLLALNLLSLRRAFRWHQPVAEPPVASLAKS
jgi:hypothetical protein